MILRPDGKGGVDVTGDPDHPANKGRLCSKGLALGETVDLTDRLLAPQINGQQTDWDTALDLVAALFSDTIAKHGPDSVAFYVSGQLLTEDYYVANKLMKGFIGSANIDTNSRLCMASTVAGHKRAFGTDTVPGQYEDLDEADLVVLVGSNLAWCHPVLYQRLAAARQARGTRIVVVDPRRTATCDIADLHLKLRADTDVALFNGLLTHLATNGAFDDSFVDAHVDGATAALEAAQNTSTDATGLAQSELDTFYRLFTETPKTVTVFSQGVNQSTGGTDKVNAIINCHLATGRIGKSGMGPFSVTGQPNAMGGREVGGLANMLAAHLDIENHAHRMAVQQFWDAPNLPQAQGLKAVDMFRAAADGRIKALWIACTNPVVSLPEADAVADAIKACDFTVVSDLSAQTDTARLANVLLPATGWGEKDGTVTNSDRTISRQRAALPTPGQARADWTMFAEVGKRMGWLTAFDYASPAEIFREHAALTHLTRKFGRDFDISAWAEMSDQAYQTLPPTRWPVTSQNSDGRFFGDGQFFTETGRAACIPVVQPEIKSRPPKYPYRLNTGRIRDQWHTMTRTAKTARLSRHMAEPFLQIHPEDALELGLAPADLAHVISPHGSALLRVLLSDDVAPGAPFAPMHWTGQTAPAARVGPLITAETDPISGQPASKASVVQIARFRAQWYGFCVSQHRVAPNTIYWAQSRADQGWRTELAHDRHMNDPAAYAKALFEIDQDPEIITDSAQGLTRLAFHNDNRLTAALFFGPAPVAVARDYVAGQLGQPSPDILAAKPGAGRPDPGPTLCSCMNVGRNLILAAIGEHGADLDRVCDATGAGKNCGSCRPEITDLIARFSIKDAAE